MQAILHEHKRQHPDHPRNTLPEALIRLNLYYSCGQLLWTGQDEQWEQQPWQELRLSSKASAQHAQGLRMNPLLPHLKVLTWKGIVKGHIA